MRLTILAGLITGAALGMQATLSAHMKPKPIPAHRAIRIRVIAPWYMADATRFLGSGSVRNPALMRSRSTCSHGIAERRRKRPRDPLALAKMVGDIATSQALDTEPDPRDPSAVEWALGREEVRSSAGRPIDA